MIAYNLDYSTLVTDENIPDSKCNVMKISDHFSCEHDPKVIRVNELNKIVDNKKKYIKELRAERDKKSNKLLRQEFIDEINIKLEELQPFIDERAKIKKTILKRPLCGERCYKFYKEIKGVIPTILQNLLDARKNTRKQMKNSICKDENCKDIAQYGIDKPIYCIIHKESQHNKLIEDEKVNDIKLLNNVLEKRQLAYKVSANSVSATTGIPCKINDIFSYKSIEDLSKGNWKRINDEQEISDPIDNLEVWSDKGFTKVKFVMRHPKIENLYRINTHTGCVECTKDHSLLRENGIEVKPSELHIGERLMHIDFPLPKDTPKEPVFTQLNDNDIMNYNLTTFEEKQAFIHGMFFAEGTCGRWGDDINFKNSWVIYNQDIKLLEKCKEILLDIEDIKNINFKISKYYTTARCYHLLANGNVKDIVNKYRNMFYDNRKYKKFPEYIFSTELKVRIAFFIGYYGGDGNRHLKKGIVISNKGNLGASSLYFLSKSLGFNVSISYDNEDSDYIYRLQCSKTFRIKDTKAIKTINIITKNEQEIIENTYKPIIRNGEKIIYDREKQTTKYRNITIHSKRFTKQQLLDSLDDAIEILKTINCYILEYFEKKVKYKSICCNKEKIVYMTTIKKNKNIKLCNCNIIDNNNYNCKNIYENKEYIEYVYDLETESHHFAAGIGNMIVHNSMYGSWGVQRGYLPFMPGAICTTFMGRTNIEIVAKTIQEKYGGKLVYGDKIRE